MPLIYLILLPFIGSLLAAFLPANARNSESTVAGLIALFCTVQAALCFPDIADGGVLRQEIEWLPALGMNLVIRMDGFAWLFCMHGTTCRHQTPCPASFHSSWPSWAR